MNGSSSSSLFFKLSCTIAAPPPPRIPSTPSSPSPQPSCEPPKFGLKAHRPFHPPIVPFIRSSTYLRYAPTIHHHLDKIKNQELYKTQKLLSLFMYFTFSLLFLFSASPFFYFSFCFSFSICCCCRFKHAPTQKIYPSQPPTPLFLLATHCFDFLSSQSQQDYRLSSHVHTLHPSIHSIPPSATFVSDSFSRRFVFFYSLSDNSNKPSISSIQSCFAAASPCLRSFFFHAMSSIYLSIYLLYRHRFFMHIHFFFQIFLMWM